MKEVNGKLKEEEVYDGKDYNIKIDMDKSEYRPEDAIGNKITIESNWQCSVSQFKRSFWFTKHGNVYYNRSEDKFHFENSQLDYPSGNYNYDHVGHFHWDTNIEGCIQLGSYGGGGFGSEWIFYLADPINLPKLQEDLGNEEWTVLSACEWEYVCETLGEYGWTVNNEPCFLIDATPGKSLLTELRNSGHSSNLSIEEFKSLEPQGLVCLPASGTLSDKSWTLDRKGHWITLITPRLTGQGFCGYYWSCTPDANYHSGMYYGGNYGSWFMEFNSSEAHVYHGPMRGNGYAVRLVILADEE
jgi:hypothetical protein